MDEICPACCTVHQGFAGREGQHHSFWQCRRCGVDLLTIRVGDTWEVHGEGLAAKMCPGILRLREYHEMLRSFGTFIYHPVLNNILKLTEDADSMSAFHDGLHKLHNDKDLPWNHSSTKTTNLTSM
jgi:hypothetical protein